MACDLIPQCNLLHRLFHCDLLEDTIDVKITVWTLKDIHTFRKDQSSWSSVCSPWGSCIKPFPSLQRKMEAYMKERWAIANPFNCYWSFPNRPNPSPFVKKPGVMPKRMRAIKGTPRKIRKNYTPRKLVTFKEDTLRQMEALFAITNPVKATPAMFAATLNPPITVNSQRTNQCVMCSALGRPCPTFFPPALTVSLPHSNWSDTESEDWDGEKQKEKTEERRNKK